MKRGWGQYIPLIGAGIAILGLLAWGRLGWSEYDREHANERIDAAQRTSDASDQIETECVLVGFSSLKCVSDSPAADKGNKNAEYDLKAQQDMAGWGFAAFWTAMVGVIITGFGVVYVALTLNETRKATAAANKVADAAIKANEGFAIASYRELRAYVSLTGIEGHVIPHEDKSITPPRHRLKFVISVSLQNTGRTPAKSVMRVMEVWPLNGSTINAISTGMLGFSGNKKKLDIGPDQPFTHRHTFECEYRPNWMTGQGGHQYEGQPGIEVRGVIEYTDFENNRWRIPYTCRSESFSTGFNPTSLDPREIGFGDLEQSEEEKA